MSPFYKPTTLLAVLGLMFVWASALVYWVELAQSWHLGFEIAGYTGILLVSGCCLGGYLYITRLERELRAMRRRLKSLGDDRELSRL